MLETGRKRLTTSSSLYSSIMWAYNLSCIWLLVLFVHFWKSFALCLEIIISTIILLLQLKFVSISIYQLCQLHIRQMSRVAKSATGNHTQLISSTYLNTIHPRVTKENIVSHILYWWTESIFHSVVVFMNKTPTEKHYTYIHNMCGNRKVPLALQNISQHRANSNWTFSLATTQSHSHLHNHLSRLGPHFPNRHMFTPVTFNRHMCFCYSTLSCFYFLENGKQ